jgi:hypothetical protein
MGKYHKVSTFYTVLFVFFYYLFNINKFIYSSGGNNPIASKNAACGIRVIPEILFPAPILNNAKKFLTVFVRISKAYLSSLY